jgi:hypothetical protein
MKAYEGVEEASPFLTSALYRGEWSLSRPCRFIPREITTGIHWTRGWVGPKAGLEFVKTLASAGNRTPAVQSVARRYID